MTSNPDTSLTIDTHHHILPEFFWRETNESDNPVGGIKPPAWSKEMMLSFMDEAGIDVAITSISTPGVHMGDDRRARSLVLRASTDPDQGANDVQIPADDPLSPAAVAMRRARAVVTTPNFLQSSCVDCPSTVVINHPSNLACLSS